jgi:hypothetical protein
MNIKAIVKEQQLRKQLLDLLQEYELQEDSENCISILKDALHTLISKERNRFFSGECLIKSSDLLAIYNRHKVKPEGLAIVGQKGPEIVNLTKQDDAIKKMSMAKMVAEADIRKVLLGFETETKLKVKGLKVGIIDASTREGVDYLLGSVEITATL